VKERCKLGIEVEELNLFNYQQSLFERICSLENLKLAFEAVRRNRGAAGIDGVTIEQFEKDLFPELVKLKRELESWTYYPQPVRRVEIPKPQGGVRELGIPCVRDRVVQTSVKAVLEPILDPQFSEHSYGFRPERNQRQAVEAAQKYVQSGKEYVVDIDLSKFFDRVCHDRLIHRLRQHVPDNRVLRLIGITLRSGVLKHGLVSPTREGTTQGSPLSPLLSNVVLDELDKELERRGLSFCRFADDCNIFVGSKIAAERVMQSVTKFIEKRLRLVVNQQKSKVALSQYVRFLGMTIVAGTIAISALSLQRARDKIKMLTPRGTSQTLEDTMKAINRWYAGWAAYYKMTQYPAQLSGLEAHIRRRLRARIISQQKRRRHLYKKLVGRGVDHKAARIVYSNRGRWALSHTPVVERAFSNSWFIDTIGQHIESDTKHPHWFDKDRWVKLT
jgi:group II intron reverse transcriptase/maturase